MTHFKIILGKRVATSWNGKRLSSGFDAKRAKFFSEVELKQAIAHLEKYNTPYKTESITEKI